MCDQRDPVCGRIRAVTGVAREGAERKDERTKGRKDIEDEGLEDESGFETKL